jgi:hypothetical protein
VSNYALGQTVRAIVLFLVGFVLTIMLLPQTGIVHSQDELAFSAVVVGLLLSLLARRYT